MTQVQKVKVSDLKSHVEKINITHTSHFIIVSADIRSRSRPWLTHYTRVIIDPISNEIIKYSCDCEGFTFRKKCWHLQLLKEMISSDLKEKVLEEEIKWYREKLLRCEVKLSQIRDLLGDD
ncbi:MAG: hypothetical protein JHC26_05145 [Thermofilum sp.]|uniref:hypothetical protein n=1 Tax=Thermofilum sp. TaxID=1961369 RepID=UPI00258709A1|nr:hypothetical protein [Thermofilum sp.]MCI4408456.1 hypothetical protein [Thermofilum sp.]